MQARRVLSLSAIALTTACSVSMLGACGDDDQTIIYVYLEAGTADTGKKDATPVQGDDDDDVAVAACTPVAPAKATFASVGKYLGKCTDTDLGTLYDNCIAVPGNTIDGCTKAQADLAGCATCAFGKYTDATQHPWLVYDEEVTAFPNFGLCMATIANETAATDCGPGYQQFYSCLNQACVTPCKEVGSQDAYDACRVAAYQGNQCTAGADTALSTKCKALYEPTNTTYGFCTSTKDSQGNTLDDRGYMIAVARINCGFAPDGGVTDAGSDADASDAGDAGDADADAK